ncbi:hotdog fold domain-containing protein [Cognatilysobacter segetis]|uniref:hotdog fold domain-containing protein n=1 Tax=Cognatilysobacter segetis TaxID=2492394 RepID=UPI00105EB393|nr:hotdog fold domain-containing protein [Lysobacter segetis]
MHERASNRLLALYRRLARFALGRWLFGRLVCVRAPYFATIAPRFDRLEPGVCEISMPDRRRVHNHLGTVHAIALCNLAELAAGVVTDATLPPSMRWIPKGMQVDYLKKARGRMRAVALPAVPIIASEAAYELPVDVEVRDPSGDAVFRARIAMWVSPKRR